MNQVFVDTSALIAPGNTRDAFHQAAGRVNHDLLQQSVGWAGCGICCIPCCPAAFGTIFWKSSLKKKRSKGMGFKEDEKPVIPRSFFILSIKNSCNSVKIARNSCIVQLIITSAFCSEGAVHVRCPGNSLYRFFKRGSVGTISPSINWILTTHDPGYREDKCLMIKKL